MIPARTLSPDDALLKRLSDLPPASVVTGEDVSPAQSSDMSVVGGVRPAILLRPGSTAEVSRILAACHALGRPVAVQGGRTGLAGGASVRAGEVALTLGRMTGMEPVDSLSASVVVEAGVPLQRVQEAALAEGLRFPVDLGARGSATVGGMIATNAGGIRVMSHGMMRAQVLGLEVVLADGTVLSRLGRLAKDNSGPDLKHIFIGTEGQYGIVTRAVLALTPDPALTAMAFCALPGIAAAQRLLVDLRQRLGRRLSAFEYIDGRVHDAASAFGVARGQGAGPLPDYAPAYAMVEMEGAGEADLALFTDAMAEALEAGIISDAVLGRNAREQTAFWRFRDRISEAVFAMSSTHGFDIGIAPDRMADFLATTEPAVAAADPAAKFWIFGHLGDGNLHYIVTTALPDRVGDIVYRAVADAGGALSAEHGIGQEKRHRLPLVRSAAEIAAMRRLKAAFDPAGILNPGRVIPAEAESRVIPAEAAT